MFWRQFYVQSPSSTLSTSHLHSTELDKVQRSSFQLIIRVPIHREENIDSKELKVNMALTGDIYQESTDDNQNAKQQALTEAALANHNEEINNEQTSHGGDDSNTQENVSRSQVGVGVLAGITGKHLLTLNDMCSCERYMR